MIRNYKYKLYASKHTKDLSRLVTSTNFVWNHIVELARRYYRLYHKTLSPSRIQQHMAKLRKTNQLWSKIHSQSLQAICQRYDRALNEHFKLKGCGFPRTHKKHIGGSVLFKGNGGYNITTYGKTAVLRFNQLNKKWKFKFKVTRPWGEIKNITVKRDNDGCLYVVITCNVPEQHLEREESGSIGMDFGMKTFLTMSDGNSVNIPDYHKQSLDETSKADRCYSIKRNAKVYGSSFKRAKKIRQKTHRKAANKRSDFHWKLAHELCKKNKFIGIEDLNMNGMKRHKNWGRKVSSLGYGEFVQKLMVVAEKYGTVVQKIDRFYASSQICSECGYQWSGTKDLSVREWVCPECGTVHDRDVNAAKNILRIAIEKYTGEGVPLTGSDCKSTDGQTVSRSCDADASAVLVKNPTTSVVGVRQKEEMRRLTEYRDQIFSITIEILEDYVKYSNEMGFDRGGEMSSDRDSISTELLRRLGFDGVDTRSCSDMDNTMFGSVIYNLKDQNH